MHFAISNQNEQGFDWSSFNNKQKSVSLSQLRAETQFSVAFILPIGFHACLSLNKLFSSHDNCESSDLIFKISEWLSYKGSFHQLENQP